MRRCSGSSIERSFLRLRYDSENGLIEDCAADSDGVQGDPFAVGCALDGAAHDIAYRRCTMLNFRQIAPGADWNGDGFSDELGNRGIRYEACTAAGCTDGGFDCKSADATFDRCIARDNNRNFRIWGARPVLRDCVSETPNWRGAGQERGGPAHIWCGGAGMRVTVDKLAVTDEGATTVFVVHADNVVIDISNARIPQNATLLDADGHPNVRLNASP